MSLTGQLQFLYEYLKKPQVVGAVSPSSPSLARKMVEWIDWSKVQTVLEYGPGTGVFTEQICARMRPGTRLLAIEINPRFASSLRERFPNVDVVQDSVKNARRVCDDEGIAQADVILSGLPWASFSQDDQQNLLAATMSVLSPNGRFATFAYLQGLLLPAGQRFRRRLRDCFSRIEVSRTAWLNLPPAFVYRCLR